MGRAGRASRHVHAGEGPVRQGAAHTLDRHPGRGPEAVGYKGRIFWWYVWWPLFPLWVLIGVASVFSGGGDVPRGPRRIVWRAGREAPLEYRSDDRVVVHAPWADQRLAAALTAVVRSFDSWIGTPWDDKKK